MSDTRNVDSFKINLFSVASKTLHALGWNVPLRVTESRDFLLLHIGSEQPIRILRSWEYQEHPLVVEWRVEELIEANFRIRFSQQPPHTTSSPSAAA